jgi:hypothetical protein
VNDEPGAQSSSSSIRSLKGSNGVNSHSSNQTKDTILLLRRPLPRLLSNLFRDGSQPQLLEFADWLTPLSSFGGHDIIAVLKRLATYSLVGQMDDTMLSNCLSFLNYTEFAPLPCINHRFKRLVPNVGRCVMLTWLQDDVSARDVWRNQSLLNTMRTLRIRVDQFYRGALLIKTVFPRLESLFIEWKPRWTSYSRFSEALVAIYPLLPVCRRIDIYTGCEPSEGDPEHYGEHDPRGPLKLATSLPIPPAFASLVLSLNNERPTLKW